LKNISVTNVKILSNILMSQLIPYVKEITVEQHWKFEHNIKITVRYSTIIGHLRENGSMEYDVRTWQVSIDYRDRQESKLKENFRE
jgi:hypothetical protein